MNKFWEVSGSAFWTYGARFSHKAISSVALGAHHCNHVLAFAVVAINFAGGICIIVKRFKDAVTKVNDNNRDGHGHSFGGKFGLGD